MPQQPDERPARRGPHAKDVPGFPERPPILARAENPLLSDRSFPQATWNVSRSLTNVFAVFPQG